MTPFCSVADYVTRYGPVDDENALLACLEDATDLICAELEQSDIDYNDPTESFSSRLRRVCRSVTRRAFGSDSNASDVPFGATAIQEQAVTYSARVELSNPYGDLFLTEAERRSLGIGAMRVAVIGQCGGASCC